MYINESISSQNVELSKTLLLLGVNKQYGVGVNQ